MHKRAWRVLAISIAGCSVGQSGLAAIVISSAPTQNVTCTAGACSPTALSAVLNVNDLENMLATGRVHVSTTGAGGVQAQDIVVSAAISWNGTTTLALDAFHSITIKKGISVAGVGGMALTTDDGGSGGMLTFTFKGHIVFKKKSSQLAINGTTYRLVATLPDLAAAITANAAGDYALIRSYDAANDGTYPNSPITTAFTGSFDGLGNTISNVTLVATSKNADFYGVFSYLDGGTIANLELSGLNFTLSMDQRGGLGGLVGEVGINAVLFDDHVTGTFQAMATSVGALTGLNQGSISYSSSGGTVTGFYAGGLVGTNGDVISASYSTAAVAGSMALLNVGGSGAGGLVGSSGGSIEQSYASGNVSGAAEASLGGLLGTSSVRTAVLTDCYSRSSVQGQKSGYVGGIVGFAEEPTIGNSYSAGRLGGSGKTEVGGVIGFNDSTTANLYWDTDISGTTMASYGNAANATGLTTAQLKSGLPAGLDPAIWGINPRINRGFPYLLAIPPS